ncbi:uncharacterized protein LOC135686883 isoform X3 [Rhopilema esculentum]|uniref:uncharacterized protein LOC135686883 isoform X3 n=1 Tax=Rhopilema esculentum TaxID=499914 RepID=UPI0031D781CB
MFRKDGDTLEVEKEALLNEIKQIKDVLYSDRSSKKEQNDLGIEESEDDDSLSDDCQDEEDVDSFSYQSKASSAWMSHVTLSDDSSHNNEDEDKDHCTVNIIERTKAALQQVEHPSFTSLRSSSSLFPKNIVEPPSEKSFTETSSDSFLKIQCNSREVINEGAPVSNVNPQVGSLEWALQLNRDYQEIIKDELIRINCALRNNRCMQAEVESRSKESQNPHMFGYSFFARFRPTYFKDRFGEGPPDNEDSKDRRALKKVHPFFQTTKLWTGKERMLLAEGVENQNLERMTLSLKERLNHLKKELKNNNDNKVQKEIEEVEKKLRDLQTLPKIELRKSLMDLDFESVSRLYLPQRTEKECRIRWLNIEHPCINQSKWTKEEDTKLVSLARKYSNRHWERIAQDLGTFRTPVQCFQRFQRSLNKDLVKSSWTASEDEELCFAVDVCPKGSWLQVANMLEGRLPMQCLIRYRKGVQPGLKKGKWTKEENELLLKYCNIYGVGKWKKISQHIPGRSDCSCRERWVNFYHPDLKLRRKWSKKEDVQLLEAVAKYGVGKWTQVSKHVPGRTDNMCWRRYRIIQRDEYETYRIKIQKKKHLLNYFVHRNHEIPNIDFDKLDVGEPSEGKKGQEKPQCGSVKGAPTTHRKRKKRTLQMRKINVKKRKTIVSENGSDVKELADEDGAITSEEFEEESEEEEDDCRTSDSENDIEKQKEENDPEYEMPDEYSCDENEFLDSRCETILEAGERLLGRYQTQIATYVDVKRDLFLLKLQIDKLEDSKEKSRLITFNNKQFKELENLHWLRDKREVENLVRYQRLKVTYPLVDLKDTVNGPENLGIRPMRPVNIANMPGNLGPFTILLEVFKIDYASIMKRMQAAAASTSANGNTTASNTTNPSSTAGNKNKDSPPMGRKVPPSFPQITPIAPNLVTLKAFRQLLLHRQRLLQLSDHQTKNQNNASTSTETSKVSGQTGGAELSTSNDSNSPCKSDDQPADSFKVIATDSSKGSGVPSLLDVPGDSSVHSVSGESAAISHNPQEGTALRTCKMNGLPSSLATSLQPSLAIKDSPQTKNSFRNTQDYATLSARFTALFLWPALLSAHPARIPDLKETKLTATAGKNVKRNPRDSFEDLVEAKRASVAEASRSAIRKNANESSQKITATGANANQRNELMWNRVIRDSSASHQPEMKTVSGSNSKAKTQRKTQKAQAPTLTKKAQTNAKIQESIPKETKPKKQKPVPKETKPIKQKPVPKVTKPKKQKSVPKVTKPKKQKPVPKKRRKISSKVADWSESDFSDSDTDSVNGNECFEPCDPIRSNEGVAIGKESLRSRGVQF